MTRAAPATFDKGLRSSKKVFLYGVKAINYRYLCLHERGSQFITAYCNFNEVTIT